MSEQKHTPEEIKAAFDEAKKAWEDRERIRDAAPEMLKALKAMDDALCFGFDTQAGRMDGRKALIAARAVIAKAEGRQP